MLNKTLAASISFIILALAILGLPSCGGNNSPTNPPAPTATPAPPPYKTTVGAGFYPVGMAFSPTGTNSYVSYDNGGAPNDKVVVFNNWAAAATWSSYGSTAFQGNNFSLSVDPNTGNVYVLDNHTNDAVYEFTSAGATVASFTGYGSTPFVNVTSVAVAPNGNVYIQDYGAPKIYEYNSAGATVASWSSITGTGFYSSVAVSPVAPNNVYVSSNSQIVEYSPSGVSITGWGGAAPSPGVGQGKFEQINALAVASNGNVFVSDAENGANKDDFVQEFSPSGTFLCQWGGNGGGAGQFSVPAAIAFTSNGDVYVCDVNNARIQVFGP